jgi:hypothetical protein
VKKGDLIKFATNVDGNITKFIFKVGSIVGADDEGRELVNIDNGVAFYIPKEEQCAECEVPEEEIPPFDLKCIDDNIQYEPEWVPIKEHFSNLGLNFNRVVKVSTYEFAGMKDFDIYEDVVGYYSSI